MNHGGRIQRFFTDTCARYMDKYVPRDIGNLRDNIHKTANSITYDSEYAHAQYIGEIKGSPVVNYTTPGTGAYWDKRMMSAEGDKVVAEVQKELNRRGNR